MELHSDFNQRVVVHSKQLAWQDSPMAGVQRRMLDRIGDEVARATSIVRYAPGSSFSPHVHTGGEEFLVLEGVFQDEHGDFPAGSYIRNPPQSSHQPGSEAGCVIFVKLWQFDLTDRTPIVTHIDRLARIADAARDKVLVSPLYQDDREDVRVEHWSSNSTISINTTGGAEILVLDGGFEEGADTLEQHAWMRVPIGGEFKARTGASGAKVWVKTGGLRFTDPPAQT